MQSKAKTVEQYLKELPAERRSIVAAVRDVILKNLDEVFEEGMQYGMIGYFVPHSIYPAGYHCDSTQPLPFLCLASQKNYLSLYIMALYLDGADYEWFQKAWAKSGKKLDMGKSCLRFKKLDDLALDVLAESIRRVPAARYIAQYESILTGNARRKEAAKKPATAARKKAAVKKRAVKGKKLAKR